MSNVKVPWHGFLGEEKRAADEKLPAELIEVPQTLKARLLTAAKLHLPYVALAGVLLVVFVVYTVRSPAAAPPQARSVPVFFTTSIIPKGSPIIMETLKLVGVHPSQFTKNDRLQIVEEEQAEKLRGRLIAKKDIPANRPLYWRDIRYSEERAAFVPQRPVIRYSSDQDTQGDSHE